MFLNYFLNSRIWKNRLHFAFREQNFTLEILFKIPLQNTFSKHWKPTVCNRSGEGVSSFKYLLGDTVLILVLVSSRVPAWCAACVSHSLTSTLLPSLPPSPFLCGVASKSFSWHYILSCFKKVLKATTTSKMKKGVGYWHRSVTFWLRGTLGTY